MAGGEAGGKIGKQGWVTAHTRVAKPDSAGDYNDAMENVAVADSGSSQEEDEELERLALEWRSDSSTSNDTNGDGKIVMDKVWCNMTTCNVGFKYKCYFLQSVVVTTEKVLGVKVEQLHTKPLPQGRANRRIVVGTIFVFINVDFFRMSAFISVTIEF